MCEASWSTDNFAMRVQGNASGWKKFDVDSVVNANGNVNHGASVVQNVRAMGEDVMHAVIPLDRAIQMAKEMGPPDNGFGQVFWFAFGGPILMIGGFLLGVLLDLLEIVALPFMLLWNLINIVGHTGAAIAGDGGDADAVAGQQPRFDFRDQSSLMRQLSQRERNGDKVHTQAALTPPRHS